MTPPNTLPALSYGRYRLFRRIGAGRLTEAWEAKSFGVEGFEKLLVIKRVHGEVAQSPRQLAAFVREAKLAVRLSHANVVQVFDLGRVENADGVSYFMATEYVAGVDLSWLLEAIVASGRPLPAAACVYLVTEAAKALDHAHRRRDERMQPLGAVHGNLTPHNLLVSWDGEVKVSDFCVARALDDADEGPLLGPAGAHTAAVVADLRAVGVLLERVLALGRTGELPDALRRVALRALTPAQGFPSAAELHEELLACAYGGLGLCDGPELAELLTQYRAIVEPDAREQARAASSAAFSQVRLGDSLPPLEEEPAATGFRVPPPARVPDPTPPPSPVSASDIDESPLPSADYWPSPDGVREGSLLVLCGSGSDTLPSDVRERAREILRRYGGHLIATAATELVAVFGLTRADGRDTENAVRCGLVLLRSLAHEPGGQTALGIDAGALALGAAGELELEQGTGNADCLETARRLARAAPQRLAVSERARANLRGLFALEPLPAHAVPGFLVGEPRELEEVFGPFVARKSELSRIGELLARASTGKLTTLGLLGPAGVGKTRLLVETRARMAQRAFNVGFYMAACPPRGQQNPYSAVAAMLRVLCGVHEGDALEQIRLQQPRLRALGLTDDELVEVFAALQVSPGTAGRRRDVLLGAIVRMFHSLAEDRLHLFAWDDAQELDADSASLLASACSKLASTRAMLVFAGRSLDTVQGHALPGYVRIDVSNLVAEDALKLVSRRLGTLEVPEALSAALQTRASGHPLFIEELLHQAFESGALVLREGRLELVNLEGIIGVPRTLRALLAGRLQRLPQQEQRLLVAVATLGGSADIALCAAFLGLPLGEVNALAEELTRRELLAREGPVTVNFRSPLLAELLVSGLTIDMKHALQRRALRAYRAVRGADAEAQFLRVAEHLALGDDGGRAAQPPASLPEES
ncbi:MAG TPA: AAA family ATPase [Polyangiaceae bacterium]